MDLLTTRPIQTGWEFTFELYLSWQFGFIDNPDRQFGNGLVWTRTRIWSDGPEPLLTLGVSHLLILQTQHWILYCMACSIDPSVSIPVHQINLTVGGAQVSLEEHLETIIEISWKYICAMAWLHVTGPGRGNTCFMYIRLAMSLKSPAIILSSLPYSPYLPYLP